MTRSATIVAVIPGDRGSLIFLLYERVCFLQDGCSQFVHLAFKYKFLVISLKENSSTDNCECKLCQFVYSFVCHRHLKNYTGKWTRIPLFSHFRRKKTDFVDCLDNRPLSRRLDRCDRVIQKESGDPNGGNMCSFSRATGTSRVRHNAHYVPYAQIRFDL